jgi:hypothetical protein
MESLLAQVTGAKGSVGARDRNPSLQSLDNLLEQFRQTYDSKVTETRAEKISVSYEFRTNVVFKITASGTDHEALEAASRPDPLLGGLSGGTHAQALGEDQYMHAIDSGDVIRNQPQDDPVLQRAISKHIIAGLSEIDHSTWTVRSMSRAAQGWTFTYNCKDSLRTWLRAHGKGTSLPTVGESSGKDGQDPISLSK